MNFDYNIYFYGVYLTMLKGRIKKRLKIQWKYMALGGGYIDVCRHSKKQSRNSATKNIYICD